MAKNMAVIDYTGKVIDMRYCSDSAEEDETIKNCQEYNVRIGDTYKDGRFYSDGVLILSDEEKINGLTADRDKCLADMQELIDEVLGG